jgi:hypothetical protein
MINYYQKSVLLTDLKKNYPTYNMGKHIATAFADYTDVWGLSDKVFYLPLLNM